MKRKIINDIKRSLPEIISVKEFKKYPLFLLNCTDNDILKGFAIIETRTSIDVAIWLSPMVKLTDDRDTFLEFANVFTDGCGARKYKDSLVEKAANDDVIVESVCNAIASKIKLVKDVTSYKKLINFIDNQFDNWLLCPFNQCQYAMVLFHMRQYEKSIEILKLNIEKLNQHNPMYKKTVKFLAEIEKDLELGHKLIDSWRSQNISRAKVNGLIQ